MVQTELLPEGSLDPCLDHLTSHKQVLTRAALPIIFHKFLLFSVIKIVLLIFPESNSQFFVAESAEF